jgi:transposase InsO family protein
MPNGQEQPIAFASRSLSNTEKKYSQLDKEGLAIVFGVKKYHQYLYGRHFTVLTDHKPLLGLLGENKSVPIMASPRVQRWSLLLGGYDYQLQYHAGTSHSNADALSRLPLADTYENAPMCGDVVLLINHIEDNTTLSVKLIKLWTQKDLTLCKVYKLLCDGWPGDLDIEQSLQPYAARKDELSIEDGCILWGNRVVIPPNGQKRVLDELHTAHPGVSKMKVLARSYVWWPHIDTDIESVVRECVNCQAVRKPPAEAPLHPWEWPDTPWDRIHIDFAGPFLGKNFLVIIDSHSKWIDCHIMTAITSRATIDKLMESFSIHGLPRTIVSDNGTSFTSEEFHAFTRANGIQHITSSPWHPASNGLAERAVQTVKNGLKKITDGTLESRLSRFLARYRITPHSTTGVSPSELLMKRKLRSRLDLVCPSIASRVQSAQEKQKYYHDRHTIPRTIQVNDTVHARNFATGPPWMAGTVVETPGPLSFKVKLGDGRIIRRHMDHIRMRYSSDSTTEDLPVSNVPRPVYLPTPHVPMSDPSVTVAIPVQREPLPVVSTQPVIQATPTPELSPVPPINRRTSRHTIQAPARLIEQI